MDGSLYACAVLQNVALDCCFMRFMKDYNQPRCAHGVDVHLAMMKKLHLVRSITTFEKEKPVLYVGAVPSIALYVTMWIITAIFYCMALFGWFTVTSGDESSWHTRVVFA